MAATAFSRLRFAEEFARLEWAARAFLMTRISDRIAAVATDLLLYLLSFDFLTSAHWPECLTTARLRCTHAASAAARFHKRRRGGARNSCHES